MDAWTHRSPSVLLGIPLRGFGREAMLQLVHLSNLRASIIHSMRSRLLALLCPLLGAGLWAAKPQEPDLSTPERTIRSFVAAFTKPDFKLAARHVKDLKLSGEAAAWEAMLKQSKLAVEVLEVTTGPSSRNALVATCKLRMAAAARDPATETSTIGLQLVDKTWLIVPSKDPQNNDVLQSFVVMLSSPNDVFANAKKAAQRTACLSNLKQIAVAAQLFLGDNDDVYRCNGKNVFKMLDRYLKNPNIQICPTQRDKEGASYTFNEALAGKSMTAVTDPAKTVMFYEGSGGKLAFDRHNGSACVAFCDGHAKVIKKGEEKSLRWKP